MLELVALSFMEAGAAYLLSDLSYYMKYKMHCYY